jgi:hypothetical protein
MKGILPDLIGQFPLHFSVLSFLPAYYLLQKSTTHKKFLICLQ